MGAPPTVEEFLDDLRSAFQEQSPSRPPPITYDDIERVEDGWTLDHGDYAETNLEGVVVTKDGRRFRVVAWCDTTGWGCQNDLEVTPC